MPEVHSEVVALINRVTQAAEAITPQSEFEALPNWSSLNALRLLAALENRFRVSLDLRRYLAVNTVGELVAMVAGEVQA
jgi:acyl carrier protein